MSPNPRVNVLIIALAVVAAGVAVDGYTVQALVTLGVVYMLLAAFLPD